MISGAIARAKNNCGPARYHCRGGNRRCIQVIRREIPRVTRSWRQDCPIPEAPFSASTHGRNKACAINVTFVTLSLFSSTPRIATGVTFVTRLRSRFTVASINPASTLCFARFLLACQPEGFDEGPTRTTVRRHPPQLQRRHASPTWQGATRT